MSVWVGLQTLVTPDLIRGPRLQRRDGSRIKSGMTKKGISSLQRSRGERDRRRRRWWRGCNVAPFAPPSALRAATSPWLRHREEFHGRNRSLADVAVEPVGGLFSSSTEARRCRGGKTAPLCLCEAFKIARKGAKARRGRIPLRGNSERATWPTPKYWTMKALRATGWRGRLRRVRSNGRGSSALRRCWSPRMSSRI